jgi:hypothetical protein
MAREKISDLRERSGSAFLLESSWRIYGER